VLAQTATTATADNGKRAEAKKTVVLLLKPSYDSHFFNALPTFVSTEAIAAVNRPVRSA
jgi:hypothetical protein